RGQPSQCGPPRGRRARLPRKSASGRRPPRPVAGGARRRPAARRRRRRRPARPPHARTTVTQDREPQHDAGPLTPPRPMEDAALDGSGRGPLAQGPATGLWRRIVLTVRYHGWRTLLFRVVTFPLRFTPLRHRLALRSAAGHSDFPRAQTWYKRMGTPVSVV